MNSPTVPRWWRCDDAEWLNATPFETGSYSIPGSAGWFEYQLRIAGTVTVLEEADDFRVHREILDDSGKLVALEIHCVAPPAVGAWRKVSSEEGGHG